LTTGSEVEDVLAAHVVALWPVVRARVVTDHFRQAVEHVAVSSLQRDVQPSKWNNFNQDANLDQQIQQRL
jgi:hypothetical protein